MTIILKHTSWYMFRPLFSHHKGAPNVQSSCLTLFELPKTSQCVISSSRQSFGLKNIAFKIINYKIHWKLFHFDVYWVRTVSICVFKVKHDGREIDLVQNLMAHAQKPDFVFRLNGRVHLNRWGSQFSRLLAAEVCAPALVMLGTLGSEGLWDYWLPTPFTSFPFTSPPTHHRVPSHFERSIPHVR